MQSQYRRLYEVPDNRAICRYSWQ